MKLIMPFISVFFLATGWELVVAPTQSQVPVPLAPPPEVVVAPTPSQRKLKKVKKVKGILAAIRKVYRDHALDQTFQESSHTLEVQVGAATESNLNFRVKRGNLAGATEYDFEPNLPVGSAERRLEVGIAPTTTQIYNLNVKGKRGNTRCDTYPATEYDFTPSRMEVGLDDLVQIPSSSPASPPVALSSVPPCYHASPQHPIYPHRLPPEPALQLVPLLPTHKPLQVHIQWTGNDQTENGDNNGEGTNNEDRHNIVQIVNSGRKHACNHMQTGL